MNHLFIRSDATVSMGTGHMMRCIALAQAWEKRGGFVTFISCCLHHGVSNRIESEGFNLVQIDHICPHARDLQKTLHVINSTLSPIKKDAPGSNHWIILDGYHFTPNYQKTIMAAGIKLLVIDDYNHLDRYYADILLNQNIGSHHYDYLCGQDTLKLMGTKYVMLRSEFPMDKKPVPLAKAKNILVTMGGADPDNITLKILHAIDEMETPNLNFNIIQGPGNPHTAELKKTIQNKHSNISLIENADMPEMMGWADLAITAGGSTCWELCFMNVPMMIIILAENQIKLAAGLEKAGAAILLGDKETLTSDQITHSILTMTQNIKKLNQLKKSGAGLVDGKGTKRIIRHLLVGKMNLRPAGIDDTNRLYEWANDKEVRLSSFRSDPIPWETHLQWIGQKLNDKNTWIFMAENHMGAPLGQIRFDREDTILKISYSLDKKFRGLGLGKMLLKTGLKKIETKIDLPATIQGSIKKDNPASKSSFENCGFTPMEDHPGINSGHIVYQLQLHPVKS